MIKALLGLVVVALAGTAAADPAVAPEPAAAKVSVAAAITAALAPSLPADLAIAEVHVPAALAAKMVGAGELIVVAPRKIAAGRVSVKVKLGKKSMYVPVTFATLGPAVLATRALAVGDVITSADVSLGQAATTGKAPTSTDAVIGATVTSAIAAGAAIADGAVAMPAATPRGTAVTVIARRGAVTIKADGVLEAAARPGQSVLVRLSTTHATAHGTFAAPSTVILGVDP